MPGMNGIDLAGEIRRQDADVGIVFLSTFNEFAHQSYRVQTCDYLLKPAQEAEIFDLLDRLRVLETDVEDCIACRTAGACSASPASAWPAWR